VLEVVRQRRVEGNTREAACRLMEPVEKQANAA
jgi:hypothetical protein